MVSVQNSWEPSGLIASCHSAHTLRAGAACVLVVCCLQTAYLFGLIQSFRQHKVVIALIDEDWETGHYQPLFGYKGVKFLIVLTLFASLVTVIIACMGFAAGYYAATPNCIYLWGSLLLGAFFLVSFAQAFGFSTFLEPVIERQVAEFCNATLHWTYSATLRCKEASKKALVPAGWELDRCGNTCLERIKVIRRLGGCATLNALCHNYDYEEAGTGFCLVDAGGGKVELPPTIASAAPGWKLPEDCCRLACDTRVRCQGYAYNSANGTCFVLVPRKPKQRVVDLWAKDMGLHCWHGGMHWLPNETSWPDKAPIDIVTTDGVSDVVCKRKSWPSLVNSAECAAHRAGLSYLATSLTLLTAAACASIFQYTLITGRKGRKSAVALLHKMLCPCCYHRRSDWFKFAKDREDDSSSEEDSDDGGLLSES